jgi:CheY-like chemotaxis protein
MSQKKLQKVLFVDDDPDDLQLIQEVIEEMRAGFIATEARNGQEALAYLGTLDKDQLPCLIVLDMNMPILDGKQTVSIIKSIPAFQQIPVIIFTTSTRETDILFFEEHGVKMITKPCSYKEMQSAIHKLLEVSIY